MGIRIRNIYYMLAYAYQSLTPGEMRMYESEEFDQAEDLFALILANGLAVQLKRGISRDYSRQVVESRSPRGKILVSGMMNSVIRHDGKVDCEIDQLSENTVLNRILKTTALGFIASSNVKEVNRKRLKKVIRVLDSVQPIDLSSINWANLKYNRSNRHYRMLINICYLVHEDLLMAQGEDGTLKLRMFEDDQKMHTLFEHFIFEYIRQTMTCLKVSRPIVDWAVDDGVIDFLPQMKTDVVLEFHGYRLIIDAKYYSSPLARNERFGNLTVHSANIYQIYTYVKNMDKDHTGKVSGMLLYAGTDDSEGDLKQGYALGGNGISIRTLNLDCDFKEIRMQMGAIVRDWMEAIGLSYTYLQELAENDDEVFNL